MLAQIRRYVESAKERGSSRSVDISCTLGTNRDGNCSDIVWVVTAGGWRDPYGPNRHFGFAKAENRSLSRAVAEAIQAACENQDPTLAQCKNMIGNKPAPTQERDEGNKDG